MSRERTRMLWVDPRAERVGEGHVSDLAQLLDGRDLIVLNDAATLPASLNVQTEQGETLELRLLEPPHDVLTRAVLFGAGDYRMPTEHRPAPRAVRVGERLRVSGSELLVDAVSELSPRLLTLRFPGDEAARFSLVYRAGKPVQYSYVPEPLALWDVQTAYAARPWAVEMPSAGRPLQGALLAALRARGIRLATLTHAAGLSATGDLAIDAALPLPERYEIPGRTAELVAETWQRGGRVLAIGTTVVRALEDAALAHGKVRAGAGLATHVLSATTPLRAVHGLFTGVHMPGESHHRLLEAFVPAATLVRAVELARARGYRQHEFGDACLVLQGVSAARGPERGDRESGRGPPTAKEAA